MNEFKKYKRKKIAELRPVTGDELKYGLSGRISISPADKEAGRPYTGDMIARNPKNHDDQWLIAQEYFEENFEPFDEQGDNLALPLRSLLNDLVWIKDGAFLSYEAKKGLDVAIEQIRRYLRKN